MSAGDVIIHDSSEGEYPEKYGRTFARDAEALQQGSIPDFAPLSQPNAVAVPVAAPAPAAAPPPRKHTLMPPLVAPIEAYVGGDAPGAAQPAPPAAPAPAKDRLVASSPIAAPAPPALAAPIVPVPAPVPVRPPIRPKPIVAPIETYAGDFTEMMKKTGASAMTVLAAEQDRSDRSPVPAVMQEEKPRGNMLYIAAGTILLIAGAAGAYFAYLQYSGALAPLVSVNGSAPIFIDEREQVAGSGAALLKAVQASLSRPPAMGAVRLLYGATATTSVAAELLAKAPDIVLRNLNAGNSMAGIVNAGGSVSPFFILSVSSYGNTFSGMLWWEKAMPNDLSALFRGGSRQPLTASSTVATTSPTVSATTTATTVAALTGFRDEIVGNHDARVYRDEAGKSVILYGYWNKTTLVIARDPAAFIEILQRLATSRAR